ncbi:torsin-1B isoform X1 [Leguminivora glycinivorella]|uniref:torsin-1B isoform X1 n=1 Tax=Leguminivora glycinivorella TaxID=1035111 RepID=UPI00200E9A02|nr:torsin-1B isoform X1 [Leguminivora glycinivorella]XP_048005396.1 torsin-1B isoform X1 [Leguminivora glycinivorella]
MKYCSLLLILIITCGLLECMVAELITMSLMGAAFITGGWYKWDTIKENSYCRFMECCNAKYVPYDIEKLKSSLSKYMFGQPLVNELGSIISAHKEAVLNNSNRKALVISLHGWSGVGKNYASNMIAEALYKKGTKSQYVKLFMGDKDFNCEDLDKKKKEVMSEVFRVVKSCPTSLIIFDEIHDMCPSILDTVKPFLDHHQSVDGVDFRNSIFIFISNIGGGQIASTLLDLYGQGVKRSDVEFHMFEPIIRKTAYFTGGFKQSSTIANHLIDHYIPFLPLEQQHVEQCALAELRAHGVADPTDQMMADAMSVITYGPSEAQPIFANNGCKRFTKHIPYVVQKHKPKKENSEL